MDKFWQGFEKQASTNKYAKGILGSIVDKGAELTGKAMHRAGGAVQKLKDIPGKAKKSYQKAIKKTKGAYHEGRRKSMGLEKKEYGILKGKETRARNKKKALKSEKKRLAAENKVKNLEAGNKNVEVTLGKGEKAVPRSANERVPVHPSEAKAGIKQKGMDKKYLTDAEKAHNKSLGEGAEEAGGSLKEKTVDFFRNNKKPLAYAAGGTAAVGGGALAYNAYKNKKNRQPPMQGYPMGY